MSYKIVWPETEDEEEDPPLSRLKDLVKALQRSRDEEHGYAVVDHDSGWVLEVECNGDVRWQDNSDIYAPRPFFMFMYGASYEKILELFTLLATGQIDRIQQEPWVRVPNK